MFRLPRFYCLLFSLFAVSVVFAKENLEQRFYFPGPLSEKTPKSFGLDYEDVEFKSLDGTKLFGWFVPAKKGEDKAKGTVVFSHGTGGSLTSHLGVCLWMVWDGYNVFAYDYRGYGKSEKVQMTHRGVQDDMFAALKYIKSRKNVDQSKLIAVGYSMGGAVTIASLGRHGSDDVKAIVALAPFASYRQMAALRVGDLAAMVLDDSLAPLEHVEKLSPVPLLLVHGDADKVIPIGQSRQLFEKAKEPKQFWTIEKVAHDLFNKPNMHGWRQKIISFMDEAVGE